jgi:hypothetical protein
MGKKSKIVSLSAINDSIKKFYEKPQRAQRKDATGK